MTQEQREQAARVLEERLEVIEDNTAYNQYSKKQYEEYYREEAALRTAIACLRSPIASPETDGKAGGWVRTSERVPTEADGDTHMVLCGWLVPPFNGNESFYAYELSTKHAVCNNPKHHPLWMSLPALPEVGE